MKTTKQRQSWGPLLHMLKRAKLPWKWYILYFILSIGITAVGVALPQVAGEIMNGNFDPKLITTYSVTQMGTLLLSIGVAIFSTWIALNMDRALQRSIWKKFLHMPMKVLDRLNPSSLPSRITSDISSVTYAISYIIQLVTVTISLVSMVLVVAGMNLKLALILLIDIPYIVLTTYITGRLTYKVNNRSQTAYARFTNYVTEGLTNFRLIKASAAEKLETQRGSQAARENYDAAVYGAKVTLISSPLRYSTGALAKALVLAYGAVLVSRGEL